MPSFVLTAVDSVNRTLAAGETGYISATGGMLNADVTMAAGAMLLNYGFVNDSLSAVAVVGTNAYVENHGDLVGGGSGGTVDYYTYVSSGNGLQIVNTGRIATRGTADTSAVLVSGNNTSISNSGLIEAQFATAIKVYHDSTGPGPLGTSIVNTGSILGSQSGAIDLVGNGTNRIVNSGLILGQIQTGIGLDSITNSGTIDGNVLLGSGFGQVVNTGLITGDVDFGLGGGFVINSGTILGRLQTGDSDTQIDLRGGTVSGGVQDWGGNDVYRLDDSDVNIIDYGTGTDTVYSWTDYELANGLETLILRGDAATGIGNASNNTIEGNGLRNLLDGAEGNDTLQGRGGADQIFGEEGNDSLLGGMGDDTLSGGNGGDRLYGGTGNDHLDGGDFYDMLDGGAGNDLLIGGGNEDILLGGDGDDTLIGGRGQDDMKAGYGGRDLFVFLSIYDSSTASGRIDRIHDFDSGRDVVDLSAIDADITSAADDSFTVVGAFTGSAGELTLTKIDGAYMINADVTGDGLTDFTVRMVRLLNMTVDDLVL